VTKSGSTPGAISITWKSVALVALALAVSSIAGIVIVATVKGADALATVALSLAVLAFVIQIVVFIAQTWTSGQQALQSEQINTSTRALLAELQESARGTNRLLTNQFDKILERLLHVTEREIGKSLPPAQAVRVTEDVTRAIRRDIEPALRSLRSGDWVRPASDDDPDIERLLTTYPTEEEAAVDREAFASLTNEAQVDLQILARDELACLYGKGYPGQYQKDLQEPAVRELLAKGMVERADPPAITRGLVDSQYIRLTEYGRRMARWRTGAGPRPEYLKAAWWEGSDYPDGPSRSDS
jgi:hypothetical protein